MNTTLILTGAAAFFIGALFAWLITRYQAQSRHFTVLQELAEARRLHEFAEQVQAQTTADLAQSRHTVQELQDELQETGNRFAAAEKQIAYLQDCEAEAETLKHECAKWQQSAQNLQINNERLNTQLVQEQALSADKNTLLQQQETEKGRLKQDYDTLLEQNHALQVQNERLSTQLTQEKANIDDKNSLLQQQEAEKGRLKQEYAALLEQNHALQVQNERLNTQSEKDRQAAEEKLALLADARQNLSDQFQNLANTILEEKSRRFTEQNHDHLQQLLNPLNERIHGFSELIQQTYEKEAKERLTIENELKRLQTLNTQLHHDAKALTTALTGTQTNPRQLGRDDFGKRIRKFRPAKRPRIHRSSLQRPPRSRRHPAPPPARRPHQSARQQTNRHRLQSIADRLRPLYAKHRRRSRARACQPRRQYPRPHQKLGSKRLHRP